MKQENIHLIENFTAVAIRSPLYFDGEKIDSDKMYRTIQIKMQIRSNKKNLIIKLLEIQIKPLCDWKFANLNLSVASFTHEFKIYNITKQKPQTPQTCFIKHNQFAGQLMLSSPEQLFRESQKLIGNRKGEMVRIILNIKKIVNKKNDPN